jgi:hypothetical protein
VHPYIAVCGNGINIFEEKEAIKKEENNVIKIDGLNSVNGLKPTRR